MTQEELQKLDGIFKTKNTSYDSAQTVGKAVVSIMLSKKTHLINSLYDYIKAGFEARDPNVLERFGQKFTCSVSGSMFYCVADVFETHYHTEKAKELKSLRKKITKEAEADYAEAYHLYFGANGTHGDVKAVTKKLVTAICKNPTAPYPRVLLAHLLSNNQDGIVAVSSVAAWILNGIEIKNSKTAIEQRSNTVRLARSLEPRCYVIDENLIDNKRFMETGSPSCKIDYMNEKITATVKHRVPTPAFFCHLANDLTQDKTKLSTRSMDACTLYDCAHYMDPKIKVPEGYTMEKRAAYLAVYRSELNSFNAEMNDLIKQMEDAEKSHKEYLAQEQKKRDDAVREALEIISEAKEKEKAAKAVSEIEMALYDRGFFGHK